jgi:hypothetical protein
MPGAFAICELSEVKPLIKRLKSGNDEGCAVLERMAFIDYFTLCEILLPDHENMNAIAEAKRISGSAVIPVPPELADCLAGLTLDRTTELAEQWAKAEEFRDLIDAETLRQFLVESAGLARQAQQQASPLLFINT